MKYVTTFRVEDDVCKGFNVFLDVPEYIEYLEIGKQIEFIATVTKQAPNQDIKEYCHITGKIVQISNGIAKDMVTLDNKLRQLIIVELYDTTRTPVQEAIVKITNAFEKLNNKTND